MNTGGFIAPTGYADGVIFGGTGRPNAPYLYAIDAESGEILRQRSDAAPVFGAPAEANGVVFVSDTGGIVRALDLQSGETLWEAKAGSPMVGGAAHRRGCGRDRLRLSGDRRRRRREGRNPLLAAPGRRGFWGIYH